jgi:glycine betaine/proline transport system permease protein
MKLNVGGWFESLINWCLANLGWFFDGIAWLTTQIVGSVEFALIVLHPLVIIALLTALAAFMTRSIGITVFSAVAFLLILSMGLWLETMASLSIVLVSVAAALLIGVPLGIWAALSAP